MIQVGVVVEGKKEWIEEKVYLEVDYTDLLNIGRITIDNSKRSY